MRTIQIAFLNVPVDSPLASNSVLAMKNVRMDAPVTIIILTIVMILVFRIIMTLVMNSIAMLTTNVQSKWMTDKNSMVFETVSVEFQALNDSN